MGDLIADLLRLAKFARVELQRGPVDLSAIACDVLTISGPRPAKTTFPPVSANFASKTA